MTLINVSPFLSTAPPHRPEGDLTASACHPRQRRGSETRSLHCLCEVKKMAEADGGGAAEECKGFMAD